MAEIIQESLPEAEKAPSGLWTDLELGYYYRFAVKRGTLTPAIYVDWLIGIYEEFMSRLDLEKTLVAIKGVNLTALSPRSFAVRYVSRIVAEGEDISRRTRENLIRPFMLSEDDQNEIHLYFNKKLAILSEKKDISISISSAKLAMVGLKTYLWFHPV